jgi:hypothetical protein
VSSRTARAIQRNSVWKNQKKKKERDGREQLRHWRYSSGNVERVEVVEIHQCK